MRMLDENALTLLFSLENRTLHLQASKPRKLAVMTSVLVEESVPIIYQNQRRDVYITSGMNVIHCEQSHSNKTTTHGPNYTLFCNDVASTTLLSY